MGCILHTSWLLTTGTKPTLSVCSRPKNGHETVRMRKFSKTRHGTGCPHFGPDTTRHGPARRVWTSKRLEKILVAPEFFSNLPLNLKSNGQKTAQKRSGCRKMLRFCLGAHGRPNHGWMPSLGAGLIRLSQSRGHLLRCLGPIPPAGVLLDSCSPASGGALCA